MARTSADPRTEIVTLRLTLSEAADLNALATARGQNRSTVIRKAVTRAIAQHNRKQTAQSGQTGATP